MLFNCVIDIAGPLLDYIGQVLIIIRFNTLSVTKLPKRSRSAGHDCPR